MSLEYFMTFSVFEEMWLLAMNVFLYMMIYVFFTFETQYLCHGCFEQKFSDILHFLLTKIEFHRNKCLPCLDFPCVIAFSMGFEIPCMFSV